MKAKTIVNNLLEDADVDPKDYVAKFQRKQDIVVALVKRYAIKKVWEQADPDVYRLIVSFPRNVDFTALLHQHGVPPDTEIPVSTGKYNFRKLYIWRKDDLNQLVKTP